MSDSDRSTRDSAQWLELERLYHAALERPPEERASFVEQACAHDEWLRRELESLLAHDRPEDDFLDQPAIGVAARELAVNEFELDSIEAGSLIGPYRIPSRLRAAEWEWCTGPNSSIPSAVSSR
jgi:hypothetical protein